MTGTARRPGRERSYGALLLICCTVSFVCFFGSYLRLPVVPLYAASLGAGTVQVGMINACFLLMAGLVILSGSSFLLWTSTTPSR